MQITVICPAPMIDDANSLAMCLAEGPADGATFRHPLWGDAAGDAYAIAAFDASDEWIAGATNTLQRPAWDTSPYLVNMAGAERAQSALSLVVHDPDADPPTPSKYALIVVLGAATTCGLRRTNMDA